MEIIEKKENKLLERKEIIAKLENSNGIPKRLEIKKNIAKKLKVKEDLVIVNKVTNYFGDSNIKVIAKIYDSKESLEKNARPHMIKRNQVKEEAVEENVESSNEKDNKSEEEVKEENSAENEDSNKQDESLEESKEVKE